MNEPYDSLLLKVPEVAERLRIGQTKIYALIQSGDLPSILVGGSRRIAVKDVEAWVERKRREAGLDRGD